MLSACLSSDSVKARIGLLQNDMLPVTTKSLLIFTALLSVAFTAPQFYPYASGSWYTNNNVVQPSRYGSYRSVRSSDNDNGWLG